VTERQLLQAITIFFRDECPISVHTLSETLIQVLSGIEKNGVKSFPEILKSVKSICLKYGLISF